MAEDLAELVTQAEVGLLVRLPRQLVHGDFWDNNVGFRHGQPVLLADFDFMGERARIDDLALTLWCARCDLGAEGDPAQERARLGRLVAGYDAGLDLPLSAAERAALPLAMTRPPAPCRRLPGGLAVATQQANRAHDRERELRQHQQHRQGWLEANAHLGPQYRQVVQALAWQRRATGVAIEADRLGYVLDALGPVPESTRGRRAWRQAAAQIEHYRRSYHINDADRALGPEPHDPTQRADRQRTRTVIERVQTKQRAADRTRDRQPTSEHPSQPRPRQPRGRPGPERAAG